MQFFSIVKKTTSYSPLRKLGAGIKDKDTHLH